MDTIDEQYALMSEQVGPTYEMWRQATLEQAEWLAQYEQRAAMREAKASDGQFSRMHAQYAAYRSFRIQEQAFFELAKALDNESEPTVRTEDQVVRLEGTLPPSMTRGAGYCGKYTLWSNRQHHGEAPLSGHPSYRCWHLSGSGTRAAGRGSGGRNACRR